MKNARTPTDPSRLVCIPKQLPVSKRLKAHQRAAEIEPKNHATLNRLLKAAPDIRLSPAHLALVTGRRWPSTGKTFTVGFLDTKSATLKNRLLSHMNAWSKTANVKFVESRNAEVRITRAGGADGGYWSYLGTEILEIAPDQPTMNLENFTMETPDSEFHRVVRHETGHTLGFPHEHMRKELVARIDREKAIASFMQSQGWSRQEVIAQVLTPLEDAQIQGTAFSDEDSIMCYEISGDITTDGKPIRGGVDIDPSDFEFAGRFYPKPKSAISAPPPRVVSGPGGLPGTGNQGGPLDLLRDYFETTRSLIGTLSGVQCVCPACATSPAAASPRVQRASAQLTPDEVFATLCQNVYPPCLKNPEDISPDDDLGVDLGYPAGKKAVLAPRTNNAFGLVPPNNFIGSDFGQIATVAAHRNATVALLRKSGR